MSHRKSDVEIADRIAYLAATQCGYGYWLDVDDPVLNYVNATDVSIASPVREMLIAAIIEMGLLNSTHFIAAITWNSAGSKWIPYEFGRAKRRQLYSVYSASWLGSATTLGKPSANLVLMLTCSGTIRRSRSDIWPTRSFKESESGREGWRRPIASS